MDDPESKICRCLEDRKNDWECDPALLSDKLGGER